MTILLTSFWPKDAKSPDEKAPLKASYRILHTDRTQDIYREKFRSYGASNRRYTFEHPMPTR